jgi:probable rRNA maturation factor
VNVVIETSVDVRVDMSPYPSINESFVQKVLQAAGEHVSTSGEVSVSFVSDEEIHTLNRDYRGVDRPTDVLSFALREGDDVPSVAETDGLELLGDIVISVPRAVAQAAEYHHSVEREIGFLLVHGFLHLIGYDHQDEASEREMFQLQEDVLQKLGLTRNSVSG